MPRSDDGPQRTVGIGDYGLLLPQLAADKAPLVSLTYEERAVIAVSKAAALRGEFATDEQMLALWAKHGL